MEEDIKRKQLNWLASQFDRRSQLYSVVLKNGRYSIAKNILKETELISSIIDIILLNTETED